ncbi:YtxH domain-containing protein [Vagococcus zengguangii]|uniref:YtxH domain-containing protein n=1 Tax=Vagococcus zengguangii TaxID=2571750 RepID=A0A4D7CU43_9ENTE|nr:YtxH domain-containing protein [Vagococcus zengguangii]QCI86803.1 YtxH domain-containing protein [Vagococcus zengguangii]TLG80409.1 YtxH domain-containing protein [Vagococcus zengguangii]
MAKFSKGILFGSLIGGALGLLYAPKSGKDLRQKFSSDVNQSKDNMVNAIDTSVQNVNEMQQSLTDLNQSLANFKAVAQETLPKIASETKETIEAFKFQSKPRIKEIKQTTEQIKQHLNDFNSPQK